MKLFWLLFILCSYLHAGLTGVWFDEKNNQIEIFVKDKAVLGKYTKIQNDGKEIFDIRGVVSGDQISFCVVFEKEKCIQSWIGQHTKKNNVEKIIMLWHRSKDVLDIDEKDNLWSSIYHGKDIFARKKMTSTTKEKVEEVDFSGLWRNDRGSEMHLNVSDDKRVSGVYKTAVGKPDFEQEFPVTGFVIGSQITFCVCFDKWSSATAWVGKYEKGSIVTLWHLGVDQEVSFLISGYSHFFRVTDDLRESNQR